MRRAIPLAVVVAALAAPLAPAAQEPTTEPELGPASAAALRVVARAPGTRGALTPGRAATVLARLFRAAGDEPRQITCAIASPARATCLISVGRGGALWTGAGKVWQGRHVFRATYEISSSDS